MPGNKCYGPLFIIIMDKSFYIHTTLSIKKKCAIIHTMVSMSPKKSIQSQLRNRIKRIHAL